MQGLSPQEQQQLLLSVGTHRGERPLSPVEVAELFYKAHAAGTPLADIARGVHFEGTSMVSRFLRLLQLSPDIRHLVDWGQSGSTIAFTAAAEIARLPETDEHAAAARAVLEDGLSSAETKQLVQLRLRSGNPMEECIAATLQMRPQVVRRHVFIGAVSGPEMRDRLARLRQAERNELFQEILAAEFPDLRGVGARLGAERFTLVGGDELASTLREKYEDFEAGLNSALKRALAKE